DLVAVFVLPPSTAELERRLRARAQDSEEVVRSRMAKASDEMSHWREYDYIVINNSLDQSVADVRAILAAERLRRDRLIGLADFINRLRQGGCPATPLSASAVVRVLAPVLFRRGGVPGGLGNLDACVAGPSLGRFLDRERPRRLA